MPNPTVCISFGPLKHHVAATVTDSYADIESDLGMVGSQVHTHGYFCYHEDRVLIRWQYNILLSIWYIPIVIFGPPMNILTKKYGAALILPIAGAGTLAHIYGHLNGETKIS
jgi:hypothetical protein